MNTKFKNETQNIVEQAKKAAAKGNKRQIVLRTKDGKQLIETSLTVVAVAGAFLFLTGLVSWPLMVVAAIAGYAAKLQIEINETEKDVSTKVLESLQDDYDEYDDSNAANMAAS